MNALTTTSKYAFALAMIIAVMAVVSYSQKTEKPVKPAPAIEFSRPELAVYRLHRGSTSERSIKVNKNVYLAFCVNQGVVKINGWNRNEVRVFVENGSKFAFNVREKDPKTSQPAWVSVIPVESKDQPVGECIWGSEIEIDLPISATINIKGKGMTLDVDTVKQANVKSVGGDITLRHVSDGVSAYAGQGGISVFSSSGRMELESTTGNIVVFEASPNDIGEILKAKTNQGSITLQGVSHRQLEVNTITGEVLFDGPLLNGGYYNFSTSNGSIRLALPSTTDSAVDVSYGFGNFNSELEFVPETEDVSPGPLKRIRGKLGSGGITTLNLKTASGRISLVRQ